MKDATQDVILNQTMRKTFSQADCKAMSDFAFKTTVLANHMNLNSDKPFFSDIERKNFSTHGTIPSGIQAWVARRSTKYVEGRFRAVYGVSSDTKPQFGFELYTCTFSLGFLLLQVLAARWTDKVMRNVAPPPKINQSDLLGDDVISIFPSNLIVNWPPDKSIGDDLMNDWFWKRFHTIDNIPSSWFNS